MTGLQNGTKFGDGARYPLNDSFKFQQFQFYKNTKSGIKMDYWQSQSFGEKVCSSSE